MECCDRSTSSSLALLGAAAVIAGLAVSATGRRRRAAPDERGALVSYLRDHLGGSDTAITMLDRLRRHYEGTEDGRLFEFLYKELVEDRNVVVTLLTSLGVSPTSLKRVAGHASGMMLKWMAGGEPGDLSLLRTLEGLSTGVQGKRCMWRALASLGGVGGAAYDGRFAQLEAKALRQWEAIEERRRVAAIAAFRSATAAS